MNIDVLFFKEKIILGWGVKYYDNNECILVYVVGANVLKYETNDESFFVGLDFGNNIVT